jgi:hypothetical protein
MRVALGVSGGVAAYKAAELVRRLQNENLAVQVVMTRAAQEFVTPLTFAALTGEKVITELFGKRESRKGHRAHRRRAADRPARNRSGDSGYSRETCQWHRRRFSDDSILGDQSSRDCGSRNERQHVGASCDTEKSGDAPRAWCKGRAAR